MANKKVKNANPLEYRGIHFKSQLEKTVYVTLKEAGFPVEYEPRKFIIWQGFRPSVSFYNKDNITKRLRLEKKKIMDITYTPDFLFFYKGYLIVLEAKGMENDVFPIKKKLFRKWLEEHHPKSIYFEVYSKRQAQQAIEIIKSLDNGNQKGIK